MSTYEDQAQTSHGYVRVQSGYGACQRGYASRGAAGEKSRGQYCERRGCAHRYGYGRPQPPRYEVLEHVLTLRENERYGTRIDLNILRWNGGYEKVDLRTWRVDGYGGWIPGGGVLLDIMRRFLSTPPGEWVADQPSAPDAHTEPASSSTASAAPDGDDGNPPFQDGRRQ